MRDLTARFERGEAYLMDILNASQTFDEVVRDLGINRDD